MPANICKKERRGFQLKKSCFRFQLECPPVSQKKALVQVAASQFCHTPSPTEVIGEGSRKTWGKCHKAAEIEKVDICPQRRARRRTATSQLSLKSHTTRVATSQLSLTLPTRPQEQWEMMPKLRKWLAVRV